MAITKAIFNTASLTLAGYTSDPEFLQTPTLVTATLPIDWNEEDRDYAMLVEGAIVVDASRRLAAIQLARITTIKASAGTQIAALGWRLERAQERDKIGADGETINDVLSEREAIRKASNRAETEVQVLTSVEAIEAFTWEVLASDYPTNRVMSRLAFMHLFYDEERANIRAARDSGQSQDLLDFWELLLLAGNVDLSDPDIITGVQLLEDSGLINASRADVILNT
jgi:hypothetical protein